MNIWEHHSLKKRGLALLLALAMMVGLLPIMPTTVQAAPDDNDTRPEGIQITLADYWLTDSDDPDNVDPPNLETAGINDGHDLKFGYNMPADFKEWNKWTESEKPYTGIVQNKLGEDGYPVLAVGVGESLDYLFDGNDYKGKKAFDNVGGLLTHDDDGYYSYDSTKNFASFDKGSKTFTLSDSAVKSSGASGKDGQFFPFNTRDQITDDTKSNNPILNHYFGLHMNTRFQQPKGGVSPEDGTTPVTFSFSGDDDVWIFIDGVLVADLGGIHDACSVDINFETGDITINGNKTDTLGNILQTGSNTLEDESYHTMDFFYLERGNGDSNMEMKFNLVTTPESEIYKVNQDGKPVEGATFKLSSNDARGLIAEGTTDETGRFTLLDAEKGTTLSLRSLLINGKDATYQLEEAEPPDGYRKSGIINLSVSRNSNGSGLMLVDNPWDTGAYAQAKVRTIADTDTSTGVRTVKGCDGKDYSLDKGTVFAAVFMGENVAPTPDGIKNGKLVYGSAENGWEIANTEGLAGLDEIQGVDSEEDGLYKFYYDSANRYVADIDELPGDVKTYHWMDQENAKFTGVYLYKANDEEGTDSYVVLNADAFERDFSTVIYTPNIENRLLVRKVADDGTTRLNDAEFALYEQTDYDRNGTNATPVKTCTTGDPMVDDTVDPGVADMTGIPIGKYYLVETKAPAGYEKSDDVVSVIVDNSGVHVDAGTPDDDVSVSLGVGKIVKSMVQFADDDGIDATLHDITANLETTDNYVGDATEWAPVDGEAYKANLSYSENGNTLEYGPTKTMAYDSGWGRLNITQNFEAATPENTPKQDIRTIEGTNEPQSLNNLFSGTTIVQVKNSKEGGGEPVPTPDPDPAKVQFEITKTVTGEGWPEGASFDFTLSGEEGAPMPADTTLTVEQPDSGDTVTASFDTITFKKTGKYKYTITETAGNVDGMTYDDQTLTATVEVTKKGGDYLAEVTYESDDGDTGEKAQTFVNDYDDPSTPGGGDKPTPPDLNTVDHYLYIEGYPENYWTGEPSWDESVWPVKPQGDITRAEVATIFYRLLKEDVRDDIETTANDFTDVNADDWFNVTVSSLANMGVVKGYEDGSFRPNEPITRAEFAAIAVRFFDAFEAKYEPGTFIDVTGDEWFADAIAAAEELGLIGGYEDGSVRPNNNITRAETCAIVNRVLHRQPHEDHLGSTSEMRTWPDNQPGAWYYADMQEATNGHEYEWIEENGQTFEDWTEVLPDYDWTGR